LGNTIIELDPIDVMVTVCFVGITSHLIICMYI
jgi:hypothetical protein